MTLADVVSSYEAELMTPESRSICLSHFLLLSLVKRSLLVLWNEWMSKTEREKEEREWVRVPSGNQVSDGLLVCNHNIWWAVAGKGKERDIGKLEIWRRQHLVRSSQRWLTIIYHPFKLRMQSCWISFFGKRSKDSSFAPADGMHSDFQNLVAPLL